jgi:predicted alpha/beta-hydrolase family hydrolase
MGLLPMRLLISERALHTPMDRTESPNHSKMELTTSRRTRGPVVAGTKSSGGSNRSLVRDALESNMLRRKTLNQTLESAPGRRACSDVIHETAVSVGYTRLRQQWLSSFLVDV